MDHEVAKTLGDLELKLAELERELSSIGPGGQPAETENTPAGQVGLPAERTDVKAERISPPETVLSAPSRLIDEAIEHYEQVVQQPPVIAQPPVAPEPPIDAQPPADPEPPLMPTTPPSPSAFEERQSINIADLVRFRDKLARTMDELIDEYSRLLSLKPPAPPS